jgi:hypothetical protein
LSALRTLSAHLFDWPINCPLGRKKNNAPGCLDNCKPGDGKRSAVMQEKYMRVKLNPRRKIPAPGAEEFHLRAVIGNLANAGVNYGLEVCSPASVDSGRKPVRVVPIPAAGTVVEGDRLAALLSLQDCRAKKQKICGSDMPSEPLVS